MLSLSIALATYFSFSNPVPTSCFSVNIVRYVNSDRLELHVKFVPSIRLGVHDVLSELGTQFALQFLNEHHQFSKNIAT